MVPLVSKESAKGWLWAIVIGIFALWQFHIPQFASKFDTFPGDRGDARLVAYLMEHWHQFFRGAEIWRSPGMFYPAAGHAWLRGPAGRPGNCSFAIADTRAGNP